MEIKQKERYETPEVMVVEMVFEGVVCDSNTRSTGDPEDRNNAGNWGDF